ncbi:hypothetical protein ACFOUP_06500 [Belliella kenyensis]|uniref:Bacteriocin-type signal sequence-containing protein n=1 Tax=Belliella kenyensis TaxID=1472724 RepID=A0ABV8EI98_9BACT|nr:hypothetical protein [Belliella kenyensis]MCH7401287.1 hypothetical protein [Belliella kenyensis]MDN3602732.1 hypothetical protein [Belliella kenyensis]
MVKSNLTELSLKELVDIQGGHWLTKAIKYVRTGLEVIGAYELYSEFKEGWDSVECGCDQ